MTVDRQEAAQATFAVSSPPICSAGGQVNARGGCAERERKRKCVYVCMYVCGLGGYNSIVGVSVTPTHLWCTCMTDDIQRERMTGQRETE